MPYTYNFAKKAGGLPRQKQFGANFPFGHGLSYTSFAWDDFSLESPMVGIDGEFVFSLTVKNTGDVAGDEVVQVYIHDQMASIVRPVKELKAFARLHLEAGEKKKVTFTLLVDLFSFVG